MLYLTSKTPKYRLHQTCQLLKFLTLRYSELSSITTHCRWMLKPNINFLIPTHTCQVPLPFLTHTRCLFFLFFSSLDSTHATQLTCLLLPHCFPSLNQAAKNPRSFFLWPNPKTHAAKSMLCTSPSDRIQKAWRSQSRHRWYLAKSLTTPK